MALAFFYILNFFVSVHSFFILKKRRSGIHKSDRMVPVCPGVFMFSFLTKAVLKGLTVQKCVMFVYVMYL